MSVSLWTTVYEHSRFQRGSEYRPIVRRQLLGHGSCLDISRHVIKATQVDFFSVFAHDNAALS